MTPADTIPDRVAVVGGGAVGVTTAFDLAARGVDVTLFERDTIAAGSSGRAAGICYDAYADRRDVRIAQRALERFRDLTDSFRACPYVLLAREGDDDQTAAIERLVEQMRSRDVDIELFDAESLAAEFPALVTDDVCMAAVAHNAGVIDPTAYTETMADRARSLGVTIRTQTAVELADPTTVVADSKTRPFDAVVVAAGPATKALVAPVGVDLAMACYRAQALVTDSLAASPDALPTIFDTTGHYYVRPWGDGVMLGDGVDTDVDPTDWDDTADADFLARGRDHLQTALGVDPGIERSWAGLCTATPDRDPLVGPVADGLFVATGWHGHGLMRSPAIAEALAEQVCGGDGITGFDPTRFDGSRSFDIVEGMSLEEP